jgi:hypothetical protein
MASNLSTASIRAKPSQAESNRDLMQVRRSCHGRLASNMTHVAAMQTLGFAGLSFSCTVKHSARLLDSYGRNKWD